MGTGRALDLQEYLMGRESSILLIVISDNGNTDYRAIVDFIDAFINANVL